MTNLARVHLSMTNLDMMNIDFDMTDRKLRVGRNSWYLQTWHADRDKI